MTDDKPNVLCISAGEVTYALMKHPSNSAKAMSDQWNFKDVKKIKKERYFSRSGCTSISGYDMATDILVNVPISPDTVVQILTQNDLEATSMPVPMDTVRAEDRGMYQ